MNYRSLLFVCINILGYLSISAQSTIVSIWPDGVPDCPVDSTYREFVREGSGRRTLAVQDPTIEVFLPADYRANGSAVLICPGGGYYLQAYDWEGVEFAKWFNRMGIAAFVLKYRLPHWSPVGCKEHVALDDAKQAMRYIRAHAKEFNIDPAKLGVMGFSAGGHLASSLSTRYDMGTGNDEFTKQSSRPDFSILVYPVISSDTSIYHGGSFKNLLGENPNSAQLEEASSEKQVDENTPPTFLMHAYDDKGVVPDNSIVYFQALRKHGVPAALHIYPSGGHGFALAEQDPYLSGWIKQLEGWLKNGGWR